MHTLIDKQKHSKGEVIKEWRSGKIKVSLICGG